jgi:hypothetical protein
MTERLFSLEEVTAAMSPAFKQAQKETNVDRALRIFTDIAVDKLKALAALDELARQAQEPDMGYGSPND